MWVKKPQLKLQIYIYIVPRTTQTHWKQMFQYQISDCLFRQDNWDVFTPQREQPSHEHRAVWLQISLHSSQVHRHLQGFCATFYLLTWATCSLLHHAMWIRPEWRKCRTVSTSLMKMWNRNAINVPWQCGGSKAGLRFPKPQSRDRITWLALLSFLLLSEIS